MTRKLKALGLALVAIFAMSALVASAAQAEEAGETAEFQYEAGTATFTVEADPTTPSQIFTITPGNLNVNFTCNEVTATVTGVSGSREATAQNVVYSDTGTTPETNVCTGNIFENKVKVNFNGCDYRFTAGTTEGVAAEGKSEGTAHIICPAEKQIEVSALGCLTKVPEQTVGPIYYKTVKTGTKEEITLEAQVGLKAGKPHNKAIKYSTSGATCGVHAEEDGTYTGTVTIKGHTSAGVQTNVTIT